LADDEARLDESRSRKSPFVMRMMAGQPTSIFSRMHMLARYDLGKASPRALPIEEPFGVIEAPRRGLRICGIDLRARLKFQGRPSREGI
jgi:hypothetical protein